MNSLTQSDKGLPPQDLFSGVAFSNVKTSQGARLNLSNSYVGTVTGDYYNAALHQKSQTGGEQFEGAISSAAPVVAAPTVTVVGGTASTSSTYVIYAFNSATQTSPIASTAPVTLTNAPALSTATNYVQVCLGSPIAGASYYALVRTAGGASQGALYNTSNYSNAGTPSCMTDTGQTTASLGSSYNPSGAVRVNNPSASGVQLFAANTSDGVSRVDITEGNFNGATAGIAFKASDVANSNNNCFLALAVSTSTGGAYYCTGTYAAAPFIMSQPILANGTYTSNYQISAIALVGKQNNQTPAIAFTVGTGTTTSTATNIAGSFTSTTSGTITFTMTWANAFAYPHRAACTFTDETTNADSIKTTGATTTTLTATGTTVTGDIVTYSCSGW